jgi:hypothetical protein
MPYKSAKKKSRSQKRAHGKRNTTSRKTTVQLGGGLWDSFKNLVSGKKTSENTTTQPVDKTHPKDPQASTTSTDATATTSTEKPPRKKILGLFGGGSLKRTQKSKHKYRY